MGRGYEGGSEGSWGLKLGEEGALPWAYRVIGQFSTLANRGVEAR